MASTSPPRSDPGADSSMGLQAPEGLIGRTQVPPDWRAPSSVSAMALGRAGRHRAVARPGGGRAEAATLRAQLTQAKARDDFDAERVLSAQLARLLVARGVELHAATKLARRSLLLGESPKLREELSAWFASVGETVLAAGTLEPLLESARSPAERARIWLRIAVLRARSGNAASAIAALRGAAEADGSDPLPFELLGALSAWARDTLRPKRAARAFLEAAQRRSARRDERGAVENLLQAFHVAPGYELAAERLAQHFAQAGRFQAADEVWRACAAEAERPSSVHSRRIRDALGAGAVALALSAALDDGADGRLDADSLATAATLVVEGVGHAATPNLDGLLYACGLVQLLAARLELLAATRLAEQDTSEGARLYRVLASVSANALGDAEKSAHHLLQALEAEPAREETFQALIQHASFSGDYSLLVEALTRLAAGSMSEVTARRMVSWVSAIAEVGAPIKLPLQWLGQQLGRAGLKSEELANLRGQLSRLSSAESEADAPVELPAKNAWVDELPSQAGWSERHDAELHSSLGVLSSKPELVEAYLAALAEVRRREPDSIEWLDAKARVLDRLGRHEELEALWRENLNAEGDVGLRARLGLIRLMLREGRPERALELLNHPASAQQAEVGALLSSIASLYGDSSARGRGLSLLTEWTPVEVRAVLFSSASEGALDGGDTGSALKFGELACRADPRAARPVVAYAEAAEGRDDRVALLAFERASEVSVPRAQWCRQLVEAASKQNQPEVALRWIRRWVSLTPLNPEACAAFSRVLAQQDSVDHLNKGLSWLLGQPQPIDQLSPELIQALARLTALAPEIAQQQAGRLLGSLGTRQAELTEALCELAETTGQPRLLIAIYERQLPTLSEELAAEKLLVIAELRAGISDGGGAADALRRALERGAAAEEVLARLESLPPTITSDGELAVLQCRARALVERALALGPVEQGTDQQATDEQDTVESAASIDAATGGGPGRSALRRERTEAAQALRKWGAALWDLAGDRAGALSAWKQAAQLDDQFGDERLARDLITFAGYPEALQTLTQLAKEREAKAAAALLGAAAAVALVDGFATQAVEMGMAALRLDPGRMEALAVVEQAAPLGSSEQLAEAYALAQQSLLGAYGERALNYRAARRFERRGDHGRALQHAVRAFESVPAEGVSLTLMLRLASLSPDDQTAALAIERVASRSGDAKARMLWLDRAASAMGPGPEGRKHRIEVLLRALSVQVEVETLEVLAAAFLELEQAEAGAAAELGGRFDESARAALRTLERPSHAAAALAISRIGADQFGNAGLCAAGLTRALYLAPDAEAFQGCPHFFDLLKDCPGSAATLVEAVVIACDKQPRPAVELLELAERLAARLAPHRSARLVVAQAEHDPANLELLDRARELAGGDSSLSQLLESLTPWDEQLSTVTARVEQLKESEPQRAVELLKLLLKEPRLDGAAYVSSHLALVELHRRLGQVGQLEELLTQALESPKLDWSDRTQAARDLSASLADRQAFTAALDVLLMAERWDGLELSDYRRAADIAAQCGDAGRELSVLLKLEMLSPEGERPQVWRRTAALHEQVGQVRQAVDCYERVLEVEPTDEGALAFIRRDAEQREDWRRVAELLEDELERSEPTSSDFIGLATIFQARMSNPAEAARVLQLGLSQLGERADLLEALAKALRAADKGADVAHVYLRASRTTTEPRHAARYAELACRVYLDQGDADSANQVLAVKGVYPQTEPLASLRVEIARRVGEASQLGVALEELAVISMANGVERAGMLLESAELALEQGDIEQALSRAQRASRIAPDQASVRLFTCALEYRQRGAGNSDEALRTISELRAIGPLEDPELGELRSFLMAEALDRRLGEAVGLTELEDARLRYGARPLVCLGIADRLEMRGESAAALELYAQALGGDLRGLRDPLQLALDCLSQAQRLGDVESALKFATEADRHSPGMPEVQELLGQLHTAVVQRRSDARMLRGGEAQRKERQLKQSSPPPKPSQSLRSKAPSKPTSQAPSERRSSQPPARSSDPAGPTASEVSSSSQPAAMPSLSTDFIPSLQTEPLPLVSVRPSSSDMATASEKEAEQTTHSAEPVAVAATPASALQVSAPPVGAATAEQEPTFELTRSLPPRGVEREVPPEVPIGTQPTAGGPQPQSGLLPNVPSLISAPRSDATPEAVVSVALAPAPEGATLDVSSNTAAPEAESFWRSSLPAQPGGTGPAAAPAVETGLSAAAFGPAQKVPLPSAGAISSIRRSFNAASDSELELFKELQEGSVEAGRKLSEQLEQTSARIQDLVSVRRALVLLRPGDGAALQDLIGAARRDGDYIYEAALAHARDVVTTPAEAPAPPRLDRQQAQGEELQRLLDPESTPVLEALTTVWQEARHVFGSQSQSLPGYTEIPLGASTDEGRLMGTIARLLGVTRTVIRQRRGPPELEFRVRLDQVSELLIDGEGEFDAPDVQYHLGAMLFATRSEYALMYALGEDELRTIIDSMLAAFGPPRRLQGDVATIARLAESLWESLSPRSQRRMQELCADPELMSYEVAISHTNRAMRRAGLFVCGDLGVALKQACLADGESALVLRQPNGMVQLCRENERVADLVRFATSREYAEARWRTSNLATSAGEPD